MAKESAMNAAAREVREEAQEQRDLEKLFLEGEMVRVKTHEVFPVNVTLEVPGGRVKFETVVGSDGIVTGVRVTSG